ncbi:MULTISPECIES: hypothetical protein [unclassified Breznakia]|uniref:hypothetical protein n=1 Tax=unclassified Breznakia TaxID=2623764 RepID=UPI002473D4A2|nr:MULTISPECIES: hypothetical protein [unclassified Breznakia]MDH6367047.1 hypothetical protein [Breznakia sp. PH1-1]MDH6404181.1 hypothetical protein [Breznakia sp. PF1-11]MDH6411934.1 hypothetical protein [Breznakia sp. PFB1-11]MDH6414169.1 hypothetical protein [Breznakia sp. PFB1-14]MDH6418922.1 hypothetical protein [Breznakia sp. PFB1-12]
MNKKILLGIFALGVLSGCGNKDLGLGNYEYHYVTCSGVIELHNEEITSWKDNDGEQLEFTLKSTGNDILASANYCVLSEERLGE